jgi:hypothetical protein
MKKRILSIVFILLISVCLAGSVVMAAGGNNYNFYNHSFMVKAESIEITLNYMSHWSVFLGKTIDVKYIITNHSEEDQVIWAIQRETPAIKMTSTWKINNNVYTPGENIVLAGGSINIMEISIKPEQSGEAEIFIEFYRIEEDLSSEVLEKTW